LNSTCLQHVLTLQHEASLGIPAVVHAVFGALDHPKGERDTVQFLLAAFLAACGEYQYVVISPSNSWRLRPDGRDFAVHSFADDLSTLQYLLTLTRVTLQSTGLGVGSITPHHHYSKRMITRRRAEADLASGWKVLSAMGLERLVAEFAELQA
jgi:hypothetical protein